MSFYALIYSDTQSKASCRASMVMLTSEPELGHYSGESVQENLPGAGLVTHRRLSHAGGGSRIYKRGGGLTEGSNLLGRGVRSTLPSMQSMLELGGSGGMPPRNILKNRC